MNDRLLYDRCKASQGDRPGHVTSVCVCESVRFRRLGLGNWGGGVRLTVT